MRLVVLAAILWAAGFSYLAIARHDAFQSNAFDLGYVTQTLWNTAHGAPFHFTTIDGFPFPIEGGVDASQLHRPTSLLAFHVEPILLLVTPLFALWPDPRFLLILQSAALAGGAVAIAALARRRLTSDLGAAVFGMAYLLSPQLGAAALSDFHGVTIGALTLALSLYWLATGRSRLAAAGLLLTALAREDAAIAVTSVGLYLYLRHRRAVWLAQRRLRRDEPKVLSVADRVSANRSATAVADRLAPASREHALSLADPFDGYRSLGLRVLLCGGAWVLISFGLIVPFFNGTLGALRRGLHGVGSVFWDRYDWLGANPLVAARNLILKPGLLIGWFGQLDVQSYLLTLLLTAGIVGLVAPEVLLVAAPIVLQDALSSFDWMRSGGAHYSMIIVPLLAFAAIEGTRRGLRWIDRASIGASRSGATIASRLGRVGIFGLILVAALANQIWLAPSPLVPGFQWPTPGPREETIDRLLARVPSSASVSATSSVYPHLATRREAYWYPAINQADLVAIDAVTSSSPINPFDLRQQALGLLAQGDYAIQSVASGFLLLRRNAEPSGGNWGKVPIPSTFYDFVHPSADELAGRVPMPSITFGGAIQLDGYQIARVSSATVFGPSAVLETYWHTDRPIQRNLKFVFYLTRRTDGALIGVLDDVAPEAVWYPPAYWQTGETVRLTVRFARADTLRDVGVAVVDVDDGSRLAVQAPAGAALWENGTIARVAALNGA